MIGPGVVKFKYWLESECELMRWQRAMLAATESKSGEFGGEGIQAHWLLCTSSRVIEFGCEFTAANIHWLPVAANDVVECVIVIGGGGNLEW